MVSLEKKEQGAWKYVTDTADGLISSKILAYNNFFFYERGLYQEHCYFQALLSN